jgi:hypothetical protein
MASPIAISPDAHVVHQPGLLAHVDWAGKVAVMGRSRCFWKMEKS